ncbi:hypothetical protein LAZ67_3003592 [Cordylochernes scorpioides]|uniref:RNA-directed DNA polymerase n=1 Tax=Cordylochernes scorpioides TaxID=51811 RepID=A0ABY6K8V5_9ARAC|nr:hypothetical protein LAZ67_3003592 [Cordylochernes scorpioides]
MLQLPLKRLRFNQISPFASNNKKPRNDIATERLSRQDKGMEFNQDPTGVKSDGPTETMERRQEVRESESARERQEVTDRETTAPLADAVNQLSTFLTRVKISDGAESAIPPFDGAYSATQFFQTFDRKMEDASMGEQEKLLRLPNYLVRQPLELFRKLRLADRSYFQVRQILLDLYPESSEASFAKYFAMKLAGQANLETYYREKTAMGLQLGLPQEVILETLTEGLPFNDQRLVRVVPPENLGEWFRLVQRIHGPSVPTTRSREDQPPTMSAFATFEGLYQPTRLPFGLKTSPQIYERAISQVLQRHGLDCVAHYFDDFIIYSNTLEEHQNHLRQFFAFCEAEKLQLNFAKCEFFKQSINFLGYTITAGTITPLTRNTDIIHAIKQPHNRKTLQSFLGAVNVYNKFIPEYARLRAPLNNLLKKDVVWNWNEACQEAFIDLKGNLTQHPILHLYKEGLPCQVYCDASTLGIAGILKQVHPDGNVYPVQYFSRTLRPHEKNYSISELECLAIVESVEKFRIYLMGRKFTIFSDHHALQWLKTIKNPSGRLFRWSLRLSSYEYEVRYIKGKLQYEADLLSRNPFCGFLDATLIKTHQSPPSKESSLTIDHNGLHTVSRKGVTKIILPKPLIQQLLQTVHTQYNHPGISQMSRIISTQYYWQGMSKDIKQKVKTCPTCQLTKRPVGPTYGELSQPPESKEPFDLLSLDTIAGFAKYGNTKIYLHVVVDHFSRYAWAFPSKSTSTTTYQQVLKRVFQDGSPKRLLTDRAPAFTSPKFRSFLLNRNIHPLLTTSNNPQANGLCERLNATLTGKLRLLHLENPKVAWTKLVKKRGFQYVTMAIDWTFPNMRLIVFKGWLKHALERCKTRLRRLKTEESAKPQPSATIGRDASADPVVLNPNMDIPKYDGTEDPRPWIESLEEIGFLYHWAEYIISRYAAMNMIGSAKTWLDLHKISFTSWEHFKSRLIQDFGSDANKEELKMRLNRMQQWNEPAIRFAEDILVLCNKVDPQMEEENKINWVIGGLKKEYSFALYLNPPKNTNELLRLCKKMDLFENNYQERIEKSKALYNGPRSPRSHHQEQWKNAPSFRRPDQNTSKPQAPAPRYYQNTKPQAPAQRHYQNKPLPQVSAPRRFYTPIHEPKPVYPRKTYNKSPDSNRNRTEDGRPICFKCNKPGHVARYCRVKFVRIVEEDPSVSQDKSQENLQMDERKDYTRPRLYADVCNDTQTNIPTRNRYSVLEDLN